MFREKCDSKPAYRKMRLAADAPFRWETPIRSATFSKSAGDPTAWQNEVSYLSIVSTHSSWSRFKRSSIASKFLGIVFRWPVRSKRAVHFTSVR